MALKSTGIAERNQLKVSQLKQCKPLALEKARFAERKRAKL
jgi:hypothetical protein